MTLTKEQLLQNAEAMIAFANGRPIEYKPQYADTWRLYTTSEFMPALCDTPFRPKAEPKTRVWNCPDDVPGPVCWLKRKRSGWPCIIAEVNDEFIAIGGGSAAACTLRWVELEGCQYSTDRKTWLPCTVEIEGDYPLETCNIPREK